jgi:uncharacterized protein (TIGR00369 family)
VPGRRAQGFDPSRHFTADAIRVQIDGRGQGTAVVRYSLFPVPDSLVPLVPQDPDFEARVRRSFAKQRVMETIGARLVRVAPGEVDVELPFREDLTQQHGFLHAGVVGTVLDSACGYAAFTLMPAAAEVLSIEFKVNLLAPARGERIIARGRVVRAGRTITVSTADAFAVQDGAERHVSTMTATLMAIIGREGGGG